MDEEIVKILQDANDEKTTEEIMTKEIIEQDIASGQAIIFGKNVAFTRREFLDGKMSIMIPTEWTDLPLELAKQKYPYENRPPIIITDVTTTINFTVHYLPQPLEYEAVAEFTKVLKGYTDKGVRCKFWEEDVIEEEEGRPIGWFDFTVSGADADLYNFVCCTSLDHRALLISFNCYESVKERWQMVAFGMINTLQLFPSEVKMQVKKERELYECPNNDKR